MGALATVPTEPIDRAGAFEPIYGDATAQDEYHSGLNPPYAILICSTRAAVFRTGCCDSKLARLLR